MSENNTSAQNVFQTILLIILVIFSALQVAFVMGVTPQFTSTKQEEVKEVELERSAGLEKTIREALLQHEYSKVGGKENYELTIELQKAILQNPNSGQDIATLRKMLDALKGQTNAAAQTAESNQEAQTAPTQAVNVNTLADEKKADVLSGAVIEGNKDADIVVVEYMDMECPYCIMQFNDNQITKRLKEEYGDKVATVMKNHRGVDHPGTEYKALGLLCANKLGGTEAYSKFYSAILAGSTARGSVYDVAKVPELVKEIGLDVSAWEDCVKNKEFIAQFAKETAEGKSFGLSGTPGTLIFNQKTGKYATVVGAYPYEQFKATVDSLLAE